MRGRIEDSRMWKLKIVIKSRVQLNQLLSSEKG
jgi:hypothetical protein